MGVVYFDVRVDGSLFEILGQKAEYVRVEITETECGNFGPAITVVQQDIRRLLCAGRLM